MEVSNKKRIISVSLFILNIILLALLTFTGYIFFKVYGQFDVIRISQIVVFVLICLSLLFNNGLTIKLKNNGNLAYLIILAGLGLGFVFCYQNINIFNTYILKFELITELLAISYVLILIIFVLSVKSQKYVTEKLIDSNSNKPTFQDEIELQKEINDLKRKEEIKRKQEEIIKLRNELNKK